MLSGLDGGHAELFSLLGKMTGKAQNAAATHTLGVDQKAV